MSFAGEGLFLLEEQERKEREEDINDMKGGRRSIRKRPRSRRKSPRKSPTARGRGAAKLRGRGRAR